MTRAYDVGETDTGIRWPAGSGRHAGCVIGVDPLAVRCWPLLRSDSLPVDEPRSWSSVWYRHRRGIEVAGQLARRSPHVGDYSLGHHRRPGTTTRTRSPVEIDGSVSDAGVRSPRRRLIDRREVVHAVRRRLMVSNVRRFQIRHVVGQFGIHVAGDWHDGIAAYRTSSSCARRARRRRGTMAPDDAAP